MTANKHDSKIFREFLDSGSHDFENRKVLLDSAYVGKPVFESATNAKLRTLVVPKKKSNGLPTHTLNDTQKVEIKQRWHHVVESNTVS